MSLLDQALACRLRGDFSRAFDLTQAAFEMESRAARLFDDISGTEPTRSVLYRSAATIALECNGIEDAEQLIQSGLSGNPPERLISELRDLLSDLREKERIIQDRQIIMQRIKSLETKMKLYEYSSQAQQADSVIENQNFRELLCKGYKLYGKRIFTAIDVITALVGLFVVGPVATTVAIVISKILDAGVDTYCKNEG